MFITASKPVSKWLNIFGLPGFTATSMEEGSALDAFVFLGLIALGIAVLNKRQASLSKIIRENAWLTAFLLYCMLSIAWSDFPAVSLKRWIKILGHPIMVLILVTEPDFREALLRLMKRCAYVILPVSILWMKYYPELGRKSDEYGSVTNSGIAEGKNGLGGECAILGLLFYWHFIQILRTEKSAIRRNELRLIVGLLLMIGYCQWKAHSATSWAALVLGALTMLLLGLRSINKKLVGAYAISAIVTAASAQLMFDVYGKVVDLSGHESTIEGRGRLWQTLLETDTHPIIGTGFESYWLGERLETLWAQYWWTPTQAHNGYLEIYLNLGIVGLSLLVALILATFRKTRLELLRNFEWARLRMSFLIAVLAHNWTEAGFKGLSFYFFVFLLVATNYPKPRIDPLPSSSEATSPAETKLVYSQDKVWQCSNGIG